MKNDTFSPRLRRAWFSGYRVADVRARLGEFSNHFSGLWNELEAAKAALAEAEREQHTLAARLHEAEQREHDQEYESEAHGAERLRQAELEAAQILENARLDAARIGADAALETEQARAQVDELLRLRDTLAATMRALNRDFENAMNGVERGERIVPETAKPGWAAAAEPAHSSAVVPLASPAELQGSVFERRVQVEAGPFADFASLSAFERSLGSLPKVEDVYIRRFEGDRATIDVTLEEPSRLLDEMNERMPYRLSVDHAANDRIALSVAAAA